MNTHASDNLDIGHPSKIYVLLANNN